MKSDTLQQRLVVLGLAGFLLCVILLGFVIVRALYAATSAEKSSMVLPFTDFRVRVQQGWKEHLPYDNGGIDYILGALDACATWKDFDIVAPFAGEACANCGTYVGRAIKIKHEGQDGTTFFTYLGHLSEIRSEIPDHSQGDTGYLTVETGEYLGKAGAIGAPGCQGYGLHHLHFHVLDPTAADPYDLEKTRESYYPYKPEATPKDLGPDNYWATEPPSYSSSVNIALVSPNSQSPADVGSPDNPHKFTLMIYAPSKLKVEDFAVHVASNAATVISANELSVGEYALEVQPPTQFTTGLYSLTIDAGGLSGELPDAVKYTSGTEPNVDIVLVIDRSGSMSGSKLSAAKNAATQFVELMQAGDKIGLVSFASGASIDYLLSTFNSTVKEDVQAEIAALQAYGNTAIGQGLEQGQNELSTRGDSSHPHAMVLLSDGHENVAPYVNSVLPGIIEAGTVIHTIGLGSDVDELLMQAIAAQTGGTYYFAPDGGDLVEIYNQISASVSGQQTVFLGSGFVTQGATTYEFVEIDSTVSEATFSINWAGSDLDLSLVSPDGIVIDPALAATDPNIQYSSTTTLEFYRLSQITPGLWQIRVDGITIDPAGEMYGARVTARTMLTLQAAFDRSSYLEGDPIRVTAVLADGQPITAATVQAVVQLPNSITTTIPLVDDGSGGDNVASDGIYAAIFTDTVQSGSYTLLTEADGVSSQGEGFRRFDRASLVVEDNPESRFDLAVEIGGPGHAKLGAVVTFNITYTNEGPDLANNVDVALELPENLAYLGDSAGGAVQLEDLILWNIGSLAPNEVHNLIVTATVEALSLVPQLTTANIFAEANGGDTPSPFDPNHQNNVSTIVTLTQEHVMLPFMRD